MAAAQGFVTTSPDAQWGTTAIAQSGNYATAQKFTLGGTGTQELSEIGMYAHAGGASPGAIMAVFTHDAANDCPESLVTNSGIAITLTGASYIKVSASYGTKPQLTGGDTYWIVFLADGVVNISADAAAGELERTATYPTWPDGTAWETHSHYNYDLSFYAVYAAASTGQFARPAYYYAQL